MSFHGSIRSICIHRVDKWLDWKIESDLVTIVCTIFLDAAFVQPSFEEGRYLFYLMHGGS
jgi:hypothetical protein